MRGANVALSSVLSSSSSILCFNFVFLAKERRCLRRAAKRCRRHKAAKAQRRALSHRRAQRSRSGVAPLAKVFIFIYFFEFVISLPLVTFVVALNRSLGVASSSSVVLVNRSHLCLSISIIFTISAFAPRLFDPRAQPRFLLAPCSFSPIFFHHHHLFVNLREFRGSPRSPTL